MIYNEICIGTCKWSGTTVPKDIMFIPYWASVVLSVTVHMRADTETHGTGDANTKFGATLLWMRDLLKEWKMLGKVPNKTNNNLPSIYMAVTFLENLSNTWYSFVTREQVLGTNHHKQVFHLQECPVKHLKVTANFSFSCTFAGCQSV